MADFQEIVTKILYIFLVSPFPSELCVLCAVAGVYISQISLFCSILCSTFN